MTEKSDMEELFNDFEQLPEKEDTVFLDEPMLAPEDDFFEQDGSVDDPIYSKYGELPPPEWNSHEFKTAGGKTIQVKHDRMGTLWSISFKEGGQLPKELSGKFTTDTHACQAVEMYLSRQ